MTISRALKHIGTLLIHARPSVCGSFGGGDIGQRQYFLATEVAERRVHSIRRRGPAVVV